MSSAGAKDEPYKWNELKVSFSTMKESQTEQFLKDFPTYKEGLAVGSPGNHVTLAEYPKHAENVYNFKLRPDDVFVCTFPKSGTTWMQELVWMVVNDCDFAKAKTPLSARSPFLEVNCLLPQSRVEQYGKNTIASKTYFPFMSKFLEFLDYYKVLDVLKPLARKVAVLLFGKMLHDLDDLDKMKDKRVIKSHLPLYLLPPNLLDVSKVVYVARNPKDVIVSYFHYHRLVDFHKYTGDLEKFADYFISDKLFGSPYFPHLLQAWNKRHHPNLHFVFYEDLKRDLRSEVEKVCKFLGKSFTDEQLTALTKHLRLDSFAENRAVNYEYLRDFSFMDPNGKFIRKGKTGDWKNHFSPELNERIDRWIEANLEGTDLSFITELEQQD